MTKSHKYTEQPKREPMVINITVNNITTTYELNPSKGEKLDLNKLRKQAIKQAN